jgi:hypothetical protein
MPLHRFASTPTMNHLGPAVLVVETLRSYVLGTAMAKPRAITLDQPQAQDNGKFRLRLKLCETAAFRSYAHFKDKGTTGKEIHDAVAKQIEQGAYAYGRKLPKFKAWWRYVRAVKAALKDNGLPEEMADSASDEATILRSVPFRG